MKIRSAIFSVSILFTWVNVGAESAFSVFEIYVAPDGTDDSIGSFAAPTSLPSAIARIAPGGYIYLRGGTYRYSDPIKIERGNNGAPSAIKHLFAYSDEVPILNFAEQRIETSLKGLLVRGNYWHIKGVIVERASDNGIYISGSHNIIERVVTRYNGDTGLQLGRAKSSDTTSLWPSYNLIVSSESHDNKDLTGENADGFAAKLTSGPGNVFRYDIAHHNADDGWDLFTRPETGSIGAVTIEDSIAYENGVLSDGTRMPEGDRNGFKLGGRDIAVDHVIRRNLAYNNGQHGFTYNRNLGAILMMSNLAINNTERNFNFSAGKSVFSGNTSCNGQNAYKDKTLGIDGGGNAWWNGENGVNCPSDEHTAFSWWINADGSLGYKFD